MTQTAVALIKRFEGLELDAYRDIGGVWTIGYGHTGPDVQPGMRIDEAEAERLLASDLAWRAESLAEWAEKHQAGLNENEFAALLSFVFNVGFPAFAGSTAAKRLAAGDRAGAAEALTWWNGVDLNRDGRITDDERIDGLKRRRAAEKELFLKPVETA